MLKMCPVHNESNPWYARENIFPCTLPPKYSSGLKPSFDGLAGKIEEEKKKSQEGEKEGGER